MQVSIVVDGLDEAFATIIALGPVAAESYFVGVLSDVAAVPRARARTRNYGFTDRSGRLRGSIRKRQRTLRISPVMLPGGRAKHKLVSIYAGRKGARQAWLVEMGHGGPFPARPHPYLRKALTETTGEMRAAMIESATRRWPAAVVKAIARGQRARGSSRYATLGRTVARRGRRR